MICLRYGTGNHYGSIQLFLVKTDLWPKKLSMMSQYSRADAIIMMYQIIYIYYLSLTIAFQCAYISPSSPMENECFYLVCKSFNVEGGLSVVLTPLVEHAIHSTSV